MLLADELYCIAHDDRGRSRVPDRAVDVGLAAALLGELVLTGHVDVCDGRLEIVDGSQPQDALAYTVFEQLLAQRQCRQVRIWLALLAGWSFDAVGERLERRGLVTRTKKRWGRVTRYIPVDPCAAAVPADRLRRQLVRGVPEVVADGLAPWLRPTHRLGRRCAAGCPGEQPPRDGHGRGGACVTATRAGGLASGRGALGHRRALVITPT